MSSATSFLVFLAAMTVLVGQLCYFAYDTFRADEQLKHRLALLPVRRGASARSLARSAEGAGSAGDRLTVSTRLRGDELEFARRIERLRVPLEVVPAVYFGLRLATAILLAAAGYYAGRRFLADPEMSRVAAIAAIAAIVGWSVPHMIVGRLAARRRRFIAQGLPDALELLVIAVESGLSLEDALGRVVAELRASQPTIAAELAVTAIDLRLLPSREAALRRLSERVNLPSLQSVVTTLVQTLTYGTPLADALRVVAAEMRNDSLIRLEERANQMPVMLTVPMVLFILPSLFLIIGGPAALRIWDVFIGWR